MFLRPAAASGSRCRLTTLEGCWPTSASTAVRRVRLEASSVNYGPAAESARPELEGAPGGVSRRRGDAAAMRCAGP